MMWCHMINTALVNWCYDTSDIVRKVMKWVEWYHVIWTVPWEEWCCEICDVMRSMMLWDGNLEINVMRSQILWAYIHVCYLSICFHVLQELTQQGGWERDVIDPVSVELDQGVRGELNQAVLLSGINVPTHQYVHCVLYNNKTMQKCQ